MVRRAVSISDAAEAIRSCFKQFMGDPEFKTRLQEAECEGITLGITSVQTGEISIRPLGSGISNQARATHKEIIREVSERFRLVLSYRNMCALADTYGGIKGKKYLWVCCGLPDDLNVALVERLAAAAGDLPEDENNLLIELLDI